MTSAGILHLGDVAKELKANELSVLRLIARRRIQANAVRPLASVSMSDWRITTESLISYIQAGSPDLRILDSDRGWFDMQKLEPGYGFMDAVRQAAETQFFDDEAAIQFATQRANLRTDAFERPIRLTPEVRAVIDKPTPVAAHIGFVAMQAPALPTWGLTYLGKRFDTVLQGARAFQPSGSKGLVGGPLSSLYRSPDQYTRLIGETLETVAGGEISFRRGHRISGMRSILIRYVLQHTEIANRQAIASIPETLY